MRKRERKKDEIVNADGCESGRTRGVGDQRFHFITDSNLMNVQQRSGSYFSGELAKHIITQR